MIGNLELTILQIALIRFALIYLKPSNLNNNNII